MQVCRLLRPVASLQRSIGFYCDALGFAVDDGGTDAALLEAVFGQMPRGSILLRLGAQRLELAEFAADALPPLPDRGAGDPRFQHIAVVVRDMGQAWARLQTQAPMLHAITLGGPQRLPPASGGVTACKFRDPDGHPVELLAYPEEAVPAAWQADAGTAVALGIDHSALCVVDAERALRFYRDTLGMAVSSRQLNHGAAQARLDGLPDAQVDVIGLAPARPTPHLELLGYRGGPPPYPAAAGSPRPRSCTMLLVDDMAALQARWRSAVPPLEPMRPLPQPGAALAHDPDGHALLLCQTTLLSHAHLT